MIIKAKVFYQNLSKNVDAHCGLDKNLVFEPETAEFINTFEVDLDMFGRKWKDIKQTVVDYCYEQLNINEKLKASLQSVCRLIRHTSMSIGDYVVFEDGEVWLCKSVGWKVIKPLKKVK